MSKKNKPKMNIGLLHDAIKILNPNEDPREIFTIAEKYNLLPQDAMGKALEMAVNVMKDAIPCGYIRAKAYKASGPESAYLKKLLDEWEEDLNARHKDGTGAL